MIKRLTKIGFICCLGSSVVSLGLGIWSVTGSPAMSGKLVISGGILLALAGVLQLEVSNFFQRMFAEYSDLDRYPGWAPSHVARQAIDNPDRPIATKVRNLFFFDVRTALWLIIAGTFLQLIGVWI
ncbi:hypothetical protein SFA35_26115 (plasmid) [Pseudomonas sp. HR96]|uniref:hypothetical protein n=1 Tax=Pseudomonas sp. HR96 TaxID=1027966 RepID=UPI002A7507DF|nr:hypothetical protein [Pseudomonas sp. HR96]WPP02520.1 hypothetical protein SFA35_26115 [Pseudomonas sp. HR96]